MTENAILMCVRWNPWATTYFKSETGSAVMEHHFDRQRLRLQKTKQVALEVARALMKSGTEKKIEEVLPDYAAQIKATMISEKMIQRNQIHSQNIAINAQLNRAVQVSAVAGGVYVKQGIKILDETERGMNGLEEFTDELADFDARAKDLMKRTDELMKAPEEDPENLLAELMDEIALEEEEEEQEKEKEKVAAKVVSTQPESEKITANSALPRYPPAARRVASSLVN